MNFAQQGGDFLDFIDDGQLAPPSLSEQSGAGRGGAAGVFRISVCFEQIDQFLPGLPKAVFEPIAFARPPRPPKKRGLSRGERYIEMSCDNLPHMGRLSGYFALCNGGK